MAIVAPLNGPGVAVLLAARVKLTSWYPPARTGTDPVEENVTPFGKPVPDMANVCAGPLFQTQAYIVCEPPTGTDHVVIAKPVSEYGPVELEQIVVAV
jgi:hypothetical protein